MICVSSLECSGSRCTITTNAAPTVCGRASKNDCKAATPPAEAPMLATGTRIAGVPFSSLSLAIVVSTVLAPLRQGHHTSEPFLGIGERDCPLAAPKDSHTAVLAAQQAPRRRPRKGMLQTNASSTGTER